MSALSTPPTTAEEEATAVVNNPEKRRSYPSGGTAKDGGDRNFRSLYYEKVGFRGVDERKTIEALLAEDPVSWEKCAHFALKFSVPSDRRKDLWKVVLNASAAYPNNCDYVWKWREKPYHDVTRSLRVMGKIRDEWPKAKNMAVIYLLFTKRLKLDVARQLEESKSQDLMAVAEALINMAQSSDSSFDEVEVFWIAKGMFAVLGRLSEAGITEMVQMFHKRLLDNESASGNAPGGLYTHMEKIGLNAEMPIRTWFSRGFAGVLNEVSLQRIWDKVVGGSLIILVYVAVALVETSKMALMQCQTPKEGVRCLVSTSQETDDIVAQKALEIWVQDGRHLNPGGKSQSRPTSSSTATATTVAPCKTQQTAPRITSGSFHLSSEIKIPDDLKLDFGGDDHESHQNNRDH